MKVSIHLTYPVSLKVSIIGKCFYLPTYSLSQFYEENPRYPTTTLAKCKNA
jgi:hypothetical protein